MKGLWCRVQCRNRPSRVHNYNNILYIKRRDEGRARFAKELQIYIIICRYNNVCADNNIIIIPKACSMETKRHHPFCDDVSAARPTGCFLPRGRKKDLTSQGVSFGARVRHVDSISFPNNRFGSKREGAR